MPLYSVCCSSLLNPSLLSPHTSFLPVAADQAPAQRRPKPQPSADHSLCSPQLHPLSLCYLMPSADVGLYLAFSLSRSPPQRPNLRAPPSLCYLMPSADVGLCLCFPICCRQWACVCVCGSGLVFFDVVVVGAAVKIE